MEPRFDRAAKSNADRVFRSDVLHFLERIAIALEQIGNPMLTINEPLPLIPEDQDPRYNADAITCTCGRDPKKACSQCLPARMAWIYSMNPQWRPE